MLLGNAGLSMEVQRLRGEVKRLQAQLERIVFMATQNELRENAWDRGWARARLEPMKPDKHYRRREYEFGGYLRFVSGYKVPWMCYCVYRWDFLIRCLLRLGVDVQCLGPKSKGVSRKQCREIARALTRLRDEKPFQIYDWDILEHDINFWGHCGGVRIHPWGGPPNNEW